MRNVKQQPDVAATAMVVSQLNCQPLLGIDDRRYLEQLLPLCKGHVAPLGRLRLVPVAVAMAAIAKLAASTSASNEERDEITIEEQDDDNAPRTADEALARLGVRKRSA
jgi:hypothetical protein